MWRIIQYVPASRGPHPQFLTIMEHLPDQQSGWPLCRWIDYLQRQGRAVRGPLSPHQDSPLPTRSHLCQLPIPTFPQYTRDPHLIRAMLTLHPQRKVLCNHILSTSFLSTPSPSICTSIRLLGHHWMRRIDRRLIEKPSCAMPQPRARRGIMPPSQCGCDLSSFTLQMSVLATSLYMPVLALPGMLG